MICIILAAGYATRMYPLTENFPKPLLEVGGIPIISHLVRDLDSCGVINEYVTVSNHKFIRHFRNWASEESMTSNAPITVIDDGSTANSRRLGAVRDMAMAYKLVRDRNEPVLIMAGDNMLDFSLRAFLDYFAVHGTSCVMRYREPDVKQLSKCGVITVNSDDVITDMEEKPASPKSEWCVPPFYIYVPADAAMIDISVAVGCPADAPGSFLQWLYVRTPVRAMVMPGKRFDIGSIEGYENIKDNWKSSGVN